MNTFQEITTKNSTIAASSEQLAPLKVPRMETIKIAAKISNISVHALRMMVANGDVVSIRTGRKILVNVDSLIAFLSTGIPQGTVAASNCSDKENAPRVSPILLK